MTGGMFGGKPDWGSAIQAGIGGYLAGRGAPGGAQILSQLHQRQMMAQQQAMEEQAYQQHRGDDLSDYGQKLEMQAKFKGPDLTSYAQDLIAAGHQPGSPEFNRLYGMYVQQKAQNGGSPFGGMFTNPADGQQYLRPNLPQLGVEMDDPRNQGGPSSQGSGGFPGPY